MQGHCKKMIVGLIAIILPFFGFAGERTSNNVRVYGQESAPHEALVLFYMESCPHCKRFDPVLKQYATTHNLPVLAYTLDGHSLPSFPNSVSPDQLEVKRFFPDGNVVVPALFFMDLERHTILPVLKGEASANQLSQRIKAVEQLGESNAY